MPVIDKVSLKGTTYDINDTGARTNKVDNSVIAPVETGSTASQAYAEGEFFIKDGAFCTAIDSINIGDTLTENTNYTTGQLIDSLGGDMSDYIEKSLTEGLVKNDGTIDTSKHVHLQSDGYVNGNKFSTKTWTGLTSFYGIYIWTDGDNIYYSYSSKQYVLDKSTSTWNTKTWTGLTSFSGSNVWTDGDNIYYSGGNYQYVLDKSTNTWNTKTWTGLSSFSGEYIWTDGTNIYYSSSTTQYVLDKSTSTWSAKTWTGLTSFSGSSVWTDGTNIYYSYSGGNYVLDKVPVFADGYVKSDGSIVSSPIAKTRYTITATNWSNSADESGYYTYTVTLSPTLALSYPPNIYIAGAGDSTFPTDTEKDQYSLLEQCNHTATNSLTLYAKTKPDTTFYIYIEGQLA